MKTSEPSKQEQKRLLIEMMQEDEKNGMYEKSDDEVIARFMGGSYEQREIMTYGGKRNGKWTFPDGRWCYDDQLDYGVSIVLCLCAINGTTSIKTIHCYLTVAQNGMRSI